MKKKAIVSIILTAALAAAALCGCGNAKTTSETKAEETAAAETAENTAAKESAAEENAENDAANESAAEEAADSTAKENAGDEALRHIEIDIKDCGTVKLELDPNQAPITVANFIKLAESGFYDGLTFHRIMDGFMVQGGDPLGNGYGGSSETIKGEFAANGVENSISHKKGVISMARSQDPNSASSQFFIMVADGDFLDGNYAAFGWVTEGQEILDQIAKDAKPTDNNGSIKREEQPVINSIKVID